MRVSMKIRRPSDRLAGCCWLPRFADKARARLQGTLPWIYHFSFGRSFGLDGLLLEHFAISREEFLRAVRECADDESLARWFLAQPGVNPDSIERWNAYAPTVGAPGKPGALLRTIVAWPLYPNTRGRRVETFFELIEADEPAEPV
ncbi:MAG: DUF5069 domain-containing protein [Verrucomicrobiae bacterium]|nr:DUF5069 domain-containing protein [Verrucomicrobiae bacterium]